MKIIANEKEYEEAISRIDELIDLDPEKGTSIADELDLLVLLADKYEEEKYPMDLPDPIEGIKFRMEQQGLTQKDLIPYIGSRSKVSEILSGNRDLTLSMIRSLHKHLGIPAETLLNEKQYNILEEYSDIDFSRFPIAEMTKNGAFIETRIPCIKDKAEELIRYLFDKIGGKDAIPEGLFRKTQSARLNAKVDLYALQAWSLQVLAKASSKIPPVIFNKEKINSGFLRSLVGLSVLSEGPKIAQEFLFKSGIILEIVKHYKNTYIDGASFIMKDGKAIIGLTIRYDRIDNFWFTLLHEIAHLKKHLDPGGFIVDDMTLQGSQTDDPIEKEADDFAEKALIPEDSSLMDTTYISKEEVISLAEKNNIHPAIIAGRIQYKNNDYRRFSNLVGRGEVGKCFE